MSSDGSTVIFRRSSRLRRGAIRRFARKLEAAVAKGRRFDCLITNDAEVRRLNREFRGKDAVTDVLSFPALPLPNGRGFVRKDYAEPRTSRSGSLGDIAVSLGRARAQARAFGHTLEQEIQILMLHGILHLLGMDHETDSGRMARAEKRWRGAFGLPNGLIERVR